MTGVAIVIVMACLRGRHCVRCLLYRHDASTRARARHRHSRERLDRQAQRQQHDEEEFAPERHGYGIRQATTGWAGAAP